MARERRAKLRKLARFSHLRQSVIERIMHGWSPGSDQDERRGIDPAQGHRPTPRRSALDHLRPLPLEMQVITCA
jgi:hypothetical protein